MHAKLVSFASKEIYFNIFNRRKKYNAFRVTNGTLKFYDPFYSQDSNYCRMKEN